MSNLKVANFASPGGTLNVTSPDGDVIPTAVNREMKRRAQMGNVGNGVSQVSSYIHNPFIQSQNLAIPTDYRIRNAYKRYFFRTNAIVGSAVSLHAESCVSDFTLEHPDPAIEEYLNGVLEETGFTTLLLEAALEYWLIGEFDWFSFYDDVNNPSCYTGFCLLDPDKVTVNSSHFVQGAIKETLFLTLDPVIKRIVDQGPYSTVTGDLYKQLPSDILHAAKHGVPLKMSALQASRVKNGNYFAQRGESILERVLQLCMYKDKLRAAQWSIADRVIAPTEMFMIGNAANPADQAEIDAFRDVIAQSYMDLQRCIVYHSEIRYEAVGMQGKLMPLWAEFDSIDTEICAGLLTNKSFITGDASTFASDVVRLDLLNNRYQNFRTEIEKWIKFQILGPIMKIHEMYVPESKVKSLSLRQKDGKGRPIWYPKIKWHRGIARDDQSKLQLMTNLAEKGILPNDMLLSELGLDPKVVAEKLDDEMEAKLERNKKFLRKIREKGLALTPTMAEMLGVGTNAALPGAPEGGGGGDLPSSIDLGGGGGSGGPGASVGLSEPTVESELPNVIPNSTGKPGGYSAGVGSAEGLPGNSNGQLPNVPLG